MVNVQLDIKANGHGHFYIIENDEQLGEMKISISPNELTVYHTEVLPKEEGKGLARELLKSMVAYARANHLKVRAICPYVSAQFKRHPEEYEDVWKNNLN